MYLKSFSDFFNQKGKFKNSFNNLYQNKKIALQNLLNSIRDDKINQLKIYLTECKNKISLLSNEIIDKKIKKIINDNKGNPLKEKEANNEFENFWLEYIQEIQKDIDKAEIRKNTENFIIENYSNSCKSLLSNTNIYSSLMDFLKDENKNNLFSYIIDDYVKKECIIFSKDDLIVNEKKLLNFEKEKYFALNEKILIGRKVETYKIISIYDFLNKDIINGIMKNKIKLENYPKGFFNFSSKQKKYTFLLEKEFLKEFEKDCKNFGIELNKFSKTTNEIINILIEIKKNEEKGINGYDYYEKIIGLIIDSMRFDDKNILRNKFLSKFFNKSNSIKEREIIKDEYIPFNISKNIIIGKEEKNINCLSKTFMNNKSLVKYIQRLVDNTACHNFEAIKFDAANFFKKFLLIDNIIDEIIYLTHRSFLKDINQNIQYDYFSENNKLKNAIENNSTFENYGMYSQYSSQKLVNLINNINNLINEINETSLNVFSFSLSESGIRLFHMVAMCAFSNLHSNLEIYRYLEPIRINNSEKEHLQKYFISILTKDNIKIDLNTSNLLAKEISKLLKETLISEYKHKYEEEINTKKNDYDPKSSMEVIDKNLMLIDDKQKILKSLLDPKEYLKEEFENKWKIINDRIVSNIQKDYDTRVKNYFGDLIEYLNKLIDHIKKNNLNSPSNLLFSKNIENIDNSGNNNEDLNSRYSSVFNITIKKYFFDLLQNKFSKQNYEDMEVNGLKFIKKENIIFEDLEFKYNNDSIKSIIINFLQNKEIFELSKFLENFKKVINEEKELLINEVPTTEKLDETGKKKEFWDCSIGCFSLCKICGRKCDQKHDVNIVKHRCSSGHRFKCFGGSKYDSTNKPSFISCDQMKPDDYVYYESNLNYFIFLLKRY